MAKYSLNGALATAASAIAPVMNITGAATVRARIYDIILGSVATPADNAAKFQLQRSTTAGTTPVTVVVAQALDPAEAAAVTTCNQGTYATNPVLTAAAFLLQWSQNQRATFRWVAAPGGEFVIPAVAANGIALVSPSGAAIVYDWMVHFEE